MTHSTIYNPTIDEGEKFEADSGSMLVGRLGYCLPFSVLAGATTAVACGLISTWTPDTSTADWIGYQILFGLRGMGLQMVSLSPNLPIIYLGVYFTLAALTLTDGENPFIIGYNLGAKRRYASPKPNCDRLYDICGQPGGGHLHYCWQRHLYADPDTASLGSSTVGEPRGGARGGWRRRSGAGPAAPQESGALRAAARVLRQHQRCLLPVGSARRRVFYRGVGNGLGGYTEEGAGGERGIRDSKDIRWSCILSISMVDPTRLDQLRIEHEDLRKEFIAMFKTLETAISSAVCGQASTVSGPCIPSVSATITGKPGVVVLVCYPHPCQVLLHYIHNFSRLPLQVLASSSSGARSGGKNT